jgi:hypothetical protein
MNIKVVQFPTSNPIVPEDMMWPEVRGRAVDGVGVLFVPDGPADRFPAVVVSEGLGGLKPEREFGYTWWIPSGHAMRPDTATWGGLSVSLRL